jgi:hypothetical protein
MILKLFYLALFLSLDILFYLRLGKKMVKAGRWLLLVTIIWLIALTLYLPTFHLSYLMHLKGFLMLSGTIVQLIFVHFVGRFIIWGVNLSNVSEDIKQNMNRIMSLTFDTVIFVFYFLLHLILILSWNVHR